MRTCMWRRYCCLPGFSDCRYMPQSWRCSQTNLCDGAEIVIFGDFLRPVFQLAACSTFQRVSRIGFVTAAMSVTGGQPNFAWCLAVSCAGALCIHFLGLLLPDGILPGANFTLRPSLAFSYIGSITARHSTSGRQPNFAAMVQEVELRNFRMQTAPAVFGWAAITLGIGPHSSYGRPM